MIEIEVRLCSVEDDSEKIERQIALWIAENAIKCYGPFCFNFSDDGLFGKYLFPEVDDAAFFKLAWVDE